MQFLSLLYRLRTSTTTTTILVHKIKTLTQEVEAGFKPENSVSSVSLHKMIYRHPFTFL